MDARAIGMEKMLQSFLSVLDVRADGMIVVRLRGMRRDVQASCLLRVGVDGRAGHSGDGQ